MVVFADDDPSEPPWPRSRPPVVVTASASWTAPAAGTTDALMVVPVGVDVACWVAPLLKASARTGSLRALTVGPPSTPIREPRLPPAAPGQLRLDKACA